MELVAFILLVAACIGLYALVKRRKRVSLRPKYEVENERLPPIKLPRVTKRVANESPRPMAPIQQVLPPCFVVVDLETTGLKPDLHEIIEVAAIRVNRDSDMHETFTSLIRPKRKIPKRITEITGITNEMVENDGEPVDVVVAKLFNFVGTHRLVFYNKSFDLAFLRKAALTIGRDINNPTSCALEMARRAYPGMSSYRLSEVAKMGGLNPDGAHRALADCRMTMIVYAATARVLGTMQ